MNKTIAVLLFVCSFPYLSAQEGGVIGNVKQYYEKEYVVYTNKDKETERMVLSKEYVEAYDNTGRKEYDMVASYLNGNLDYIGIERYEYSLEKDYKHLYDKNLNSKGYIINYKGKDEKIQLREVYESNAIMSSFSKYAYNEYGELNKIVYYNSIGICTEMVVIEKDENIEKRYTYNANGRLKSEEQAVYDDNRKIEWSLIAYNEENVYISVVIKYKYDYWGNIVEEYSRDMITPLLSYNYIYLYDYDDSGNWIKKTQRVIEGYAKDKWYTVTEREYIFY
jgi:hypothetical protein